MFHIVNDSNRDNLKIMFVKYSKIPIDFSNLIGDN